MALVCCVLCMQSTGSIQIIKIGFLPCHSLQSNGVENVRGRHRIGMPEK